MSTSAPSRTTPRDLPSASPILSWGPISINPVGDAESPGESPMTGATFHVEQIQADRQDAAAISITGDVTGIQGEHPGEMVVFNGRLDSGPLISFDMEFKGVTYKFVGVVSPSFTSMAGLVTMSVRDGSAEDEASWSSQARGGGGETDRPGGGEGA